MLCWTPPLQVVLLPDGRVMRYETDGQGNQTGQFTCDVWDPNQSAVAASQLTLPNTTGTEIFCMPSVTGVGLGRHAGHSPGDRFGADRRNLGKQGSSERPSQRPLAACAARGLLTSE